MIRDPGRVTDGFASLERGVDSGRNPSLLPRNQAAWAENSIFRGGYWMPRPGWKRLALLSASQSTDYTVAFSEGKFQGAGFFDDAASRKGLMIAQTGGYLYRIEITNAGAVVMDITPAGDPNSSIIQQVWMQQAESYLVVQDGQSRPIIFDGSTTRRAEADEVPVGSGPMAYGMLRLWVAMGRNYVAGDVAGGPTGVLKFTENDYIAEGGEFSLPMSAGNITAMQFTATPNTALGQGELLIFTPDAVFSNTAPVDRDAWKNLVQPIQTITLINNGAQSQNSTALVNGDVFMRSRDGIRSVIQAVRYFQQWGNTPLSNELSRVLPKDDPTLLKYVSAVEFDNRLLMTCQPVPLTNGCYFTGIASLDFEPITSMGEKQPPAYDGVWTGRQVYQLVKGRFAGVERCFAFCRSETDGFVSSVLIVSSGNGYTSNTSVTASGGGGSGATFSPRYLVSGLSITAAGTGYAVNDTITLVAGTGGFYGIITAVGGAGEVQAVTIINGGDFSAVPSNPVATGTNGAGTGCTLTLSYGIKSVTVTNKGSGYTSRPTIVFSTGNASAVAVVDYRMELWELTRDGKFDYGNSGNVRAVTVTSAGTGFSSIPTVSFSGALISGGAQATATAKLKAISGSVAVGGTGYTIGDLITVSGGTGTAATFQVATLGGGGSIATVTLVSGGSYSALPSLPAAVTGGTGNSGTLNLTFGVESVTMLTSGSGYLSYASVAISGGGGNGAAGFALMGGNPSVEERIEWFMESPSYGFNDGSNAAQMKRLETGDLWIDRVSGTVDFTMRYRPDQYPCWNPWHVWQVCATKCVELDTTGCVVRAFDEQYRPRQILPQPPELTESVVAKSMRTGYEFSVRLNVVGFCRIKLLRLHAKQVLETVANPVVAATESTCGELSCECD